MSKRTKRCPNCGAQMPQGAVICNKCGSKTSDAGRLDTLPRPVRPVETSRWPENAGYEDSAAQRKPVNRNVWQLVAVLAVIVVIIVLAVVLVLKMNAPQEPSVSESEQISNNGVLVIDPNNMNVESTEPPVGEEEEPEPTEEPQPTEEPEATPEPTAVPEEEETSEEEESEEEEAFTVSEMDDTVYITGGSVNLRAGPGTDYDVVTTQVKGTELKRTGAVENGWSRVEYDGKVCYIYNDYISTEKPPVEVSEKDDTVVITADANLRSGPGTDYDVVTSLTKGTELKRTGVAENGWNRVEYDGKEVYIHGNLVEEKTEAQESEETENNSEDESSESGVTAAEGTVTVTTGANIRSGPGTDHDILGTAGVGTELKMTGKTDDNWYQVEFDGKTGYIAGKLVKEN